MENRILPIIIWLSLIKDDTIRNKALEKFDYNFANKIFKKVDGIQSAISTAFNWGNTKDDINYWNNIYNNPIPIREPLKFDNTVVNVTTQEEWDIVTAYYQYNWLNNSGFTKYNSETCINLNYLGYCDKRYYIINNSTIISYNEWLEKIGAVKPISSSSKTQSKPKFDIGDTVRIISKKYNKNPNLKIGDEFVIAQLHKQYDSELYWLRDKRDIAHGVLETSVELVKKYYELNNKENGKETRSEAINHLENGEQRGKTVEYPAKRSRDTIKSGFVGSGNTVEQSRSRVKQSRIEIRTSSFIEGKRVEYS